MEVLLKILGFFLPKGNEIIEGFSQRSKMMGKITVVVVWRVHRKERSGKWEMSPEASAGVRWPDSEGPVRLFGNSQISDFLRGRLMR